jgi:putative ABC transport system permease protein
MNIVNRLTLRHMKLNKRRTLVTIIGVVISVAMVTAVATIGISFLDLFKRQSITKGGEWHVLYQGVTRDQLDALSDDQQTKALVITRDLGYAPLEQVRNKAKPYLFIKEYNAQGFKQFPIEVIEGRLPQAEREVVLSEEIADRAGVAYNIGDSITLDIGWRYKDEENDEALQQHNPLQRENGEITEMLDLNITKSYTVVGFIKRPVWEPAWAPGYTVISYVDENLLGPGDTVDAAVVLKKVNGKLYDHAKNLAQKNGINKIGFNNSLLRYYGVTDNDNLRGTLYSVSAVLMAVIVVGSVSLIYNAFAISVSERSRYLGMLSSVGATKRQKRNSVFFEGAVIAAIGIPIGILCGIAGIGITFMAINPVIRGAFGVTEKLKVIVTPLSILASCGISAVTILVSTYLPARKASRVSAIDAIRQSADVRLTGRAVKTSRIVSKLFGIEAEIGLKNLKRNRRRYQAMLFSLVISIVLFLTVSFFTSDLEKSIGLSQDGLNFDMQIYSGSGDDEIDNKLIGTIASLEDVTEHSVIKTLNVASLIDQELVPRTFKEQVGKENMSDDGKYWYYINVHALDDISLKEYAKEIGADYRQLQNEEALTGIVVDTVSYRDMQTGKFVREKAINARPGQSIDLAYIDDEGKNNSVGKLEIALLTDKLPMGVLSTRMGGLNIIVSGQTMDRLLDTNSALNADVSLYLNSADPLKTQHQIEDMVEGDINIFNVYQMRQQEEQVLLIMSVFTYGFIVLITAISIANMFNTISTGIALRKREFAMLKSVGMTPGGLNRMINYESIFYGIKSLFYGIPIGIGVMYLIHSSLMHSFKYDFEPPWVDIAFVVVAVFVMVGSPMDVITPSSSTILLLTTWDVYASRSLSASNLVVAFLLFKNPAAPNKSAPEHTDTLNLTSAAVLSQFKNPSSLHKALLPKPPGMTIIS